MDNMLSDIVLSTRRTGNTTWILRAAIRDPHCIIVTPNQTVSRALTKQYFDLLDKERWWRKLKWKWFGKEHPRILSANECLDGYSLPVIFDNSTILMRP